MLWQRMARERPSWVKLECLLTKKTADNHCRDYWVSTVVKMEGTLLALRNDGPAASQKVLMKKMRTGLDMQHTMLMFCLTKL